MRLTLRTLLAYIDDRLPPANAREIGQKIAGSPFATELVQRIREVVRRRRLAEPGKQVPRIDANLVAEYLDDQLTPELVGRIEREILQSDVSLAEVAATHEILGLLRDSVEIEPRMRDRLYALDPGSKLDPSRSTTPTAASPQGAGETSTEWKPLSSRVASSRRLPVIIMAVLALVWIALVATDEFLFRDSSKPVTVASIDDQNKAGEIEAGKESPDGDGKTNPLQEPGSDDVPRPNGVDVAVQETPEKRPAVAETETVTEPQTPMPTPEVETPVVVKPEEALPVPVKPEEVVPQNPDGPNDVAVKQSVYLEDDLQMVMRLENEADGQAAEESGRKWKPAARAALDDVAPEQLRLFDWEPVVRDHWLGTAAPFRTTITSGGWKARIAGPALYRFHQTALPGIEILEGRMVVQPDPAGDVPEGQNVNFLLQIGAAIHVITFATPETKVSIEVIAGATPEENIDGIAAPNPVFLPLTSDLYVRLFVMDGSIRIQTEGAAESPELVKSQLLSWRILTNGDSADVELTQARPQGGIPEWAFSIDTPPIAEQLEAQTEFSNAVRSATDIGVTCEQLAKDRNPSIAVMAVQLLALTRDVDRLTNVFLQSSTEQPRRAAIDGLSRIAVQTPAGQNEIRKVFENRLPMGDVEMMLRLTVGISEAQAKDPEMCSKMLTMLSHDRLASRDLALYRMEEFTQDRFGYNPDADAGRRRDAVRRWLRHVEKNEGKLIP
ncbi:MAG: hypothetical protein JNL58_29990 [Planctomyces sp.]|nr:hypothetical protein [Planctomyces sp.]